MTTGPTQDPPAPSGEAAGKPMVPPRQRQRMGGSAPLQNAALPKDDEAVAPPAPPAPGASGQKQRMGTGARRTPDAAETGQCQGRAVEAPAAPHPQTKAPRQRLGANPVATPANVPTAAPGPEARESDPTAGAPAAIPAPALPATAGGTAQKPASPAPASRGAWARRAVTLLALVVLAVVVVLGARWARTLPAVVEFLAAYPGHSSLPDTAPQGLPAWMGWQHFLNMFFVVLIVRTGLQVRREKRAPGYWKPKENSFFSPKGNTPKKVSLSQWLHQVLDVLWVVNGAVFILLLAVTGQWMRIVPTSWDLFPNMLSTAVQYASLDWPLENGWVHYNALQMAAYFLTVYVAAPLAILSGVRMSTWWPANARGLNKFYPLEVARALHFPVMLYFVAFTVLHVFLVFFTGALRNLNHMYTSRDVVDWWGLGIFVASILVIAAAWFLTKPVFTTPLATRMGTVTKN